MSELMNFLLHHADNKRVMAILRRGLVENTEMRAWPLLTRLGGLGSSQRARAVRTVAGLFATHPDNCNEGNMGLLCRRLCDENEKLGMDDATQLGPMERKFLYLLNADREEICARVCRLVRYAKSKGEPVNYAALEEDLASWPRAREPWARKFWAAKKAYTEQETEV